MEEVSIPAPAWSDASKLEELRQLALTLGASAAVPFHWWKSKDGHPVLQFAMSHAGKSWEMGFMVDDPTKFPTILRMCEMGIRSHFQAHPQAQSPA